VSTPARPRVLTVGAYERDNFGDLLFLLVTEQYLPDVDVVAAAPFAADMSSLLDRKIEAYGDLLRNEAYDAIWTVGGEIGGSTVASAYRMSMPRRRFLKYRNADALRQRAMLDEVTNGAPLASAYIPTPGAFAANAGAFTVINSAGLSGAASHQPHIRDEVYDVLRTTDVVSVRDKQSSTFLEGIGVAHVLAPDVVHALGVLDPFDRDPDADNIVVQSSGAILRQIGHRALAEALVASPAIAELKIRLLLAGTATGHDSFRDMERLRDHIHDVAPAREVEIITDRRPLDLVDHIRRARVVVSSSLHVRIVAAAYDVPRLTFTRPKPTRYAMLWDPAMPYDVEVADLDRAVATALVTGQRGETSAAAAELSRRADANIRETADRLRSTLADPDSPRAQVAQRRAKGYRDIAARREPLETELASLRHELATARAQVEEARAESAALRKSLAEAARRSFRSRARRVANRVRRRLVRQPAD